MGLTFMGRGAPTIIMITRNMIMATRAAMILTMPVISMVNLMRSLQAKVFMGMAMDPAMARGGKAEKGG